MAALTATTQGARKVRGVEGSQSHAYTVGTGAKIYLGALCCLDITKDRVLPATDAANMVFVGIAEQQVTGTTSGGETCLIRWGHQALVTTSALTKAWIGRSAYITNDNECNTSAVAQNIVAGEMLSLESATSFWLGVRKTPLKT